MPMMASTSVTVGSSSASVTVFLTRAEPLRTLYVSLEATTVGYLTVGCPGVLNRSCGGRSANSATLGTWGWRSTEERVRLSLWDGMRRGKDVQ
jgi:hypothetical protein